MPRPANVAGKARWRMGYRITGTDVLWQGWESSTRRQLNTELARLRAQKLTALDALRAAFGRKQAVAKPGGGQRGGPPSCAKQEILVIRGAMRADAVRRPWRLTLRIKTL